MSRVKVRGKCEKGRGPVQLEKCGEVRCQVQLELYTCQRSKSEKCGEIRGQSEREICRGQLEMYRGRRSRLARNVKKSDVRVTVNIELSTMRNQHENVSRFLFLMASILLEISIIITSSALLYIIL